MVLLPMISRLFITTSNPILMTMIHLSIIIFYNNNNNNNNKSAHDVTLLSINNNKKHDRLIAVSILLKTFIIIS
jgi:hypothetical protein